MDPGTGADPPRRARDSGSGQRVTNQHVVHDALAQAVRDAGDAPEETWREEYPYDRKMSRKEYDRTKYLLQIELLKLQNWIRRRGERLIILFEGGDAAGKGGSCKRFT